MQPFRKLQSTVMPLDRVNVDTDQIIPKQFLKRIERTGYGDFLFFDWRQDPSFETNQPRYKGAQILVAGKNFGCGSSREHAPIALKAVGVAAIIAKSFARIFYRNAINIGLPILEAPRAAEEIKEGDELEVDLADGLIKDLTTGKTYKAQPFPEFMQKIIEAGGLISYLKNKR